MFCICNLKIRLQPEQADVLDVRKRPWPPSGRLPLGKRPAGGRRPMGEKFTRHIARRHFDLRHPPIRVAERLGVQPHSARSVRDGNAIIKASRQTQKARLFYSNGARGGWIENRHHVCVRNIFGWSPPERR